MIKLLHCADLHLSEQEKEYSLNVLQEIVKIALAEKASFLLFCGDIFNSFSDLEKLRSEFRRILSPLPSEILYIPGNHEKNTQANASFRNLDLGNITMLDEIGLIAKESGGIKIEFLAIPHKDIYSDYLNWNIPEKKTPFRIALAHGVVTDMSFIGLDDEGSGAALDPSMFQRYQIDYAALGHLHSFKTRQIGNTTFYYPGSSRVWRSGESGPRQIAVIKIDSKLLFEPVFLKSAGEYRWYRLPLDINGSINDLDKIAEEWKAEDWIEISLFGVIEDETTVKSLEEEIKHKYDRKVRRLNINRLPEDVKVMNGISSQPLIKRFLELWEKRRPEDAEEIGVWLKARELALNKIMELMR